jgi:hypothetical protein
VTVLYHYLRSTMVLNEFEYRKRGYCRHATFDEWSVRVDSWAWSAMAKIYYTEWYVKIRDVWPAAFLRNP